MTHAELVARAQRWLRDSQRHPIVLVEIGTDGREMPDVIGWTNRGHREMPDVIGWTNRGHCTLIECKTSRADFLRDKGKAFRREAGRGMGEVRLYATPPGLVVAADLPDRWGLVEVGPRVCRVLVKSRRFAEHNEVGERQILISALRRATESWGRKVFGDISPVHGYLDPHPTVAAALKDYRAEIHSLRGKVARRDEKIAELTPKPVHVHSFGVRGRLQCACGEWP